MGNQIFALTPGYPSLNPLGATSRAAENHPKLASAQFVFFFFRPQPLHLDLGFSSATQLEPECASRLCFLFCFLGFSCFFFHEFRCFLVGLLPDAPVSLYLSFFNIFFFFEFVDLIISTERNWKWAKPKPQKAQQRLKVNTKRKGINKLYTKAVFKRA